MLKRNTLIVAVLLLVSLLAFQGCDSGGIEVDIKNVTGDTQSKDGLDPLSRGKLRRQILNETQENISIWLKGDASNYSKAFTKKALTAYEDRLEKLHRDAKDKVRLHERQAFEVTELTRDAASVKYTFVDKSYFVSTTNGKVVTPSKNAETEIFITVVREGNRWKIERLIGSGEATL